MFKKLVVLTGAGISAESGIRTFRASDGLWEEHRIEDVATPEGFAKDPALVQRFYNQRRAQLNLVKPNPAHFALAELEADWDGDFLLVTQNVDDLHERAGSNRVLHMHGSLIKALCLSCEKSNEWRGPLAASDICMECKAAGQLRPDIVWFGEMPYYMDVITQALHDCDLFISVGTSGHVYPAAGFARDAWRAKRIEVNMDSTQISDHFHEHRLGTAGVEVPRLVHELLRSV